MDTKTFALAHNAIRATVEFYSEAAVALVAQTQQESATIKQLVEQAHKAREEANAAKARVAEYEARDTEEWVEDTVDAKLEERVLEQDQKIAALEHACEDLRKVNEQLDARNGDLNVAIGKYLEENSRAAERIQSLEVEISHQNDSFNAGWQDAWKTFLQEFDEFASHHFREVHDDEPNEARDLLWKFRIQLEENNSEGKGDTDVRGEDEDGQLE